jgi:aminoglycoside phosphotransferase (APT) family kinase protein
VTNISIIVNVKTKVRINQILFELNELSPLNYEKLDYGLSTINYRINFEEHPPVLVRLYPNDGRDVQYEFILLSKLFNEEILVPQPLYVEQSKVEDIPSFCLMEFIEGENFAQLLINDPENEDLYNKYIESLVKIHQFDWRTHFPNSKVPNYNKKPYAFTKNLLNRRIKEIKQYKLKNELMLVIDWMKKHYKDAKTIDPMFLHGDYHPLNIISRDGELVIVDWEGVEIGDNRFDLAFAVVTAGIMGGESIEKKCLELYENHDLPIHNIDFFIVNGVLHRFMKLNKMLKPEFPNLELYKRSYQYFMKRIEEICGIELNLPVQF